MVNDSDIIFKEPRKTFMEVLKVSQREVPFANVLAFFFRPKEDHGLGTLFLDALLNTKSSEIKKGESENLGYKVEYPLYDINSVCVKTEAPVKQTNGQINSDKRIDLLITTNTFAICIEFKINHELCNPLMTYQSYMEKNFKGLKKYYYILTPYIKEPSGEAEKYFENGNGFKQIILTHFINEVKRQLPSYQKEAEPYHYFLDFIQTVENREIRSRRIRFLEKLEKKLSIKLGKQTLKIDTKRFFLEINKGEQHLKIRFTTSGVQIEDWKNGASEIVCGGDKSLDIKILMENVLGLVK